MTDSAPTVAELDELQKRLHERPYRLAVETETQAFERHHNVRIEAADALAALRKQRDEARMQASGDRLILARALDQAGADAEHDEKVIETLRAANAHMATALREAQDYIAAMSPCDCGLHDNAALAQPAPASSEAHDERCNCEACIEARSRGPRYKGEGNTPMQKEDYDGSCQ